MKFARYALSLILLLAWSAPALAGKKAGVTMPDTLTVAGKTLALNGMALREATLGIDVYVIGLYLEQKSKDGVAISSARQAKRLHLKFVRDVDAEDMSDAWDNGFKKVAGSNLAALKDRVATIKKWMEDIDEDKSLILTYVPDKGVEVEINGKVKGVIAGDDFATALFSIWLGPKSAYSDMRKDLLKAQ